jgi:phosphoribosylanthranilate isomerase
MLALKLKNRMVEIKICGITNINDAYVAIKCGADALGFIFYSKSQRYVMPERAKEIIQKLPYEIIKVGVFVNHEIHEVKEIAKFCGLNLIQLHGDETPEYCDHFQTSSLIKAVSLRAKEDIQKLNGYCVKAILVDAREPGHYGGTGKNSDWSLAKKLKEAYPLILAGGLHRGNIRKAIETVRPQAVDINSGVEISPGKKDLQRVKEIIAMVRETDRTINSGSGCLSPIKVFSDETDLFYGSKGPL